MASLDEANLQYSSEVYLLTTSDPPNQEDSGNLSDSNMVDEYRDDSSFQFS